MTAPARATCGGTRRRGVAPALALVAILAGAACRSQSAEPPRARSVAAVEPRIDGPVMLEHLRHLSSDSLEGRKTGTRGADSARAYIERAFARAGLRTFGGGYAQRFSFRTRRGTMLTGTNVVGYLPGLADPSRYLVVSAHYDHLGVIDGQIYNGADDNASGVAAMLAMASWIARHPPRASVIFVAFDAEEQGSQGARAFVTGPPVPRDSMLLDVNLDMISRSARGEVYVVGTHHWPALAPYVQRVAERSAVTVRPGHDTPGLPPGEDWTNASDQGPFHAAGIPFLYFGVEDHPDYHRPTDDMTRIDPAFYVAVANAILDVVLMLDSEQPVLRTR